MTRIIPIRLKTPDTDVTIRCDALATAGYSVDVFSGAGPLSAVNAFAAAFQSKSAEVQFIHADSRSEFKTFRGDPLRQHHGGYAITKHPIGYDLHHIIAVAKKAALMLPDTHDRLWTELQSARFTTPLLRSWVPALEVELRKQDKLRKATCFGCDAAMLLLTSDALDAIVSSGIRAGRLVIA